jgi:uncharacterized protein (DUF697 family)
MGDIMLWLTGHRAALIGTIAACLWVAGYTLYFKKVLGGYFARAKPHSWSLDMVNKQRVSRGHRNSH